MINKVIKICHRCGSDAITLDAGCTWDIHTQEWILRHYHEEAYCLDCEDDCYVEEKELIENEVQEESKTEQKSS